jgi:hypothetical protein
MPAYAISQNATLLSQTHCTPPRLYLGYEQWFLAAIDHRHLNAASTQCLPNRQPKMRDEIIAIALKSRMRFLDDAEDHIGGDATRGLIAFLRERHFRARLPARFDVDLQDLLVLAARAVGELNASEGNRYGIARYYKPRECMQYLG